MMNRFPVLFLILLMLDFSVFSQDAVLFTIDGQPVMKTEYERLLNKNNNGDTENDSSPEDLERFINFKLKVFQAIDAGYDTVRAFIDELAGYRDQLAKPYLQDQQLLDSLVAIAYQRTITEVNASHITVRFPSDPSPSDTAEAYHMIIALKERLLQGESFDELSREISQSQPPGIVSSGTLGWFSAFTMIMPFEDAAYSARPGEIAGPVRSRYGYHLLRVNGIRPALGEIKLAHIMVRFSDDTVRNEEARQRIDSCYNMLVDNYPFTDLVRIYSEDDGSAEAGGQMRWIRSGELPENIEKEVYALKDSGAFTKPIQSDYGWHIFQLQGYRNLPSFEEIELQLADRIRADEHGRMLENSFIEKLKAEYGFVLYEDNILALKEFIDSTIYSGNWKPSSDWGLIEPVFAIDTIDYSQLELAQYVASFSGYSKAHTPEDIVMTKAGEFIAKTLREYENNRLEIKYEEFGNIMKEYHDGILFFNIMNDSVWNKAIENTEGLTRFYEQHAGQYVWNERINLSVYTFRNEDYLKKVKRIAAKRDKFTAEEMIKMICSSDSIPCLTIKETTYEAGIDQLPYKEIEWIKDFSKTYIDGDEYNYVYVNEVIPSSVKMMDECRGQVISDYQEYLDSMWIKRLRGEYSITKNQDVLQTL